MYIHTRLSWFLNKYASITIFGFYYTGTVLYEVILI